MRFQCSSEFKYNTDLNYVIADRGRGYEKILSKLEDKYFDYEMKETDMVFSVVPNLTVAFNYFDLNTMRPEGVQHSFKIPEESTKRTLLGEKE
jgi:hypothetical protein